MCSKTIAETSRHTGVFIIYCGKAMRPGWLEKHEREGKRLHKVRDMRGLGRSNRVS